MADEREIEVVARAIGTGPGTGVVELAREGRARIELARRR